MTALDFDSIFAAAPNPYLLLGPDKRFTILGVNDAYLRATQTVREQITGRGLFEVFPDNPSDPDATGVANLRASLNQVLTSGKPHAMAVQKYDIPTAAGGFEERHWTPINSPVFGKDGRTITCVIHHVEDVTEIVRMKRSLGRQVESADRRARDSESRLEESTLRLAEFELRLRAETSLRESEARFRQLADAVPQMIWVTRPDGHHEYFNRRWYEFTGVPEGSTDGEGWNAAFHPDDQGRAWARWREALRTGEPYEIEYRLRHRSGAYRWTLGRALPVRDDRGVIERWYGTCTDIDDQKRAEEGRRRVELQLASIIDNTQAAVFIKDVHGRYLLVNAPYERITGVPVGSMTGKTDADVFPPEVAADFRREDDRVAAAVEPMTFEESFEFKGERLTFVTNKFPLRDEGGRVYAVCGIATNVTNLKNAEAAVRESEARLKLAVAIAQMGTFEIDLRTDAVTVNDSGRDIYGWEPAETLTFAKVQTHFHPDDKDGVMRRVSEAFLPDGPGEFEVEQRIIRTNGATRWIRLRGRALFEATGGERRAARCVGTYLDVTEQKEAEHRREELLERERAARTEAERASRMKDEFLATLSHEIRTPLNAILGWAQILRGSRSPSPAEVEEGVSIIERNARAQTQIIEDLLDMSRIVSGKIRLDVQSLDLAGVVKAAVETVKPAAEAKGVRLQVVLDPLAAHVAGDPNRLQQVFWNLLSNAVKFTPRGGRVHVVLERVNSHLEVSVVDTGEGIRPEFLPHVFDRFRQADGSTTRRHGGLGIGLAIVKQLMELHGGEVRAKSGGVGLGSTFTVSLPLSAIHAEPETESARRHPQAADPLAVSNESCVSIEGVRVLIVDDEPDARALVKRFFEDCKAVVFTAASVAEAMEVFRRERPDVLLSDIGMPGEDGFALIRKVRALRPEDGGSLPAVALTAYARAEDRVKTMMAGFQQHVSKPVEPAELIAVVAILSGRAGRSTNFDKQ